VSNDSPSQAARAAAARPRRAAVPVRARLVPAAVAAAVLAIASPARAQWLVDGDQFRLSYGPSAYHFSGSDGHVRYNHLVSGELLTRRWTVWGAARGFAGLALFDNSFGQFSQYVYVGQEWDLGRWAGGTWYANVTGGLLHGYKGEHKDKIPFNSAGIAPVIIPNVGWRYGRFSLGTSVLGTNGFLFTASWNFDLKP
jgi:hypothetical protein